MLDTKINKNIFFISGDTGGCAYYRVVLPANHLGCDFYYGFPTDYDNPVESRSYEDLVKFTNLKNADIIVIQRQHDEFFLEWIPKMQAAGKKIVYELDDNFWEISVTNPSYNSFPPKTQTIIKKIINLCDGVVVSTVPLRDYLLSNTRNQNIHVIPNFIEDIITKVRDNDWITIGYAGSITHKGDFSSELIKALKSFSGKIDLAFLGYNPIPECVTRHTPWASMFDYTNELNKLDIDIAIAPLASNEFNRCKSNIKFLEYSSLGIMTLASNVYPYMNSQTCRVVYDEKQWKAMLDMYIESICSIKYAAEEAQNYVRDNYTYKHNGPFITWCWSELIRSLE